jgi:hypothetical protein
LHTGTLTLLREGKLDKERAAKVLGFGDCTIPPLVWDSIMIPLVLVQRRTSSQL